MLRSAVAALAAIAVPAFACDTCYGPASKDIHVRNVRRAQPDSQSPVTVPRSPLSWGQINFLHTTDTHGWLEGHLKEQNYGADWGDFSSFVKRMRERADIYGVDLLLVDTGDLHDGAGLSDAESPDGVISNEIFEKVDYDLMTIGNHELYVSDVAYLTADKFAPHYGEKYISSNVQIYDPTTGQYKDIANKYRYFTTKHGIRIMAFGVLYDFTGNSNASKVITAANMTQMDWFKQAVNYTKPIDLFVLIGHNPVRGSSSTLRTVYNSIRGMRPDVPIQMFGGHTHIRDFTVYDAGTTGLESGRYCETLGFLAMSGIKAPSRRKQPLFGPTPTQVATKVPVTSSAASTFQTTTTGAVTTTALSATPTASTPASFNDLRYFRRYIDWNRNSFEYHAIGSQSLANIFFDTSAGRAISKNITATRKQLNLTSLYGCAPATYCISCKPFLSDGSIFKLLQTALSTTVVNTTRSNTPRMIFINTGSVRFDLPEGPFTYDDSFIVSPFHDTFQYIANVPYQYASGVLGVLNAGAYQKRSAAPAPVAQLNARAEAELCVDAAYMAHAALLKREASGEMLTRGAGLMSRAYTNTTTAGYVTTDDFGSDGDDTIHTKIPYYPVPNDLQANGSFPTDGSTPQNVDVIFLDFIAKNVVAALNKVAGSQKYSVANDVKQYLDPSFDTNSYLPAYAKIAWQANVPNCPVGAGIGS